MRIPVLAENYNMFMMYIRENDLNRGHFDYLGTENSIRGRRGVILTVGRWWRNPNYRNEGFAKELSSCVNTGLISIIPAQWEREDRLEEYRHQLQNKL